MRTNHRFNPRYFGHYWKRREQVEMELGKGYWLDKLRGYRLSWSV